MVKILKLLINLIFVLILQINNITVIEHLIALHIAVVDSDHITHLIRSIYLCSDDYYAMKWFISGFSSYVIDVEADISRS